MNRAVRVAWPALTVLVALASLLVALAIGGGATPLSSEDPGAVVRYGQPIALLLLSLSASGALGALIIAAFASKPGDERWGRLLDGAAAAAGVWTVAAAASTFIFYLGVGPAIDAPTFGPNLVLFLSASEAGHVWLSATVAAALLTVLTITVRSLTGAALLVVAAVAALIPIALQGHASTSAGDHGTAITAFGLHIVGAAAWLGGLAVVFVVGRTLHGAALADLASRYSGIALACFVIVGFSGVVSAAIRLGSVQNLFTAYGELILVKSVTLIAAGAFGAAHRYAAIPRIAAGSGRAPFLRLVGVELLVLGVASGFAAGLSVAPPPYQAIPPTITPAQVLTGSALPPPFSPATLLTQWRFDPLWVLVCGFLAVLYLAGVVRLARRGDSWPVGRTISWLAGVVLLLWITNGGLNRYEEVVFSAHMLAHMALAMVVPLLLVPAAPVTLALRAIRKRQDGTRGGREWILLAVHSRVGTLLANPLVAAVLFAGSLVVFYWSPLFRWATTDHIGHEWMTVHFLATGYLFAQSLIGIDPVPFRFPHPIRLLILLATMAFHAFFGLALILGDGLLLADWYGAMGWGTSAIADQQAGGGIAWSVGELPTLVLAIVVAVSWSKSDAKDAKRLDRAEDRTRDAELARYNGMLGRLEVRPARSAGGDEARTASGVPEPDEALDPSRT